LIRDEAASDRQPKWRGPERRAVEREPGEKYSESVARRVRRMKMEQFWSRGKIAGLTVVAAVAVVIGAFLVNPDRVKARTPASQASVTPVAVKAPKTSYTDNVLYTDHYLETMRDSRFRKLWSEELGRAIARDWKLEKDLAGPVVAKETALIEDLARLKAKLSGENGADAIVQMRARESAFQKDLAGLFKNRQSVDRFLKFKHSFYMRHGRSSRQ
jgi:hypothetical protein